MKPPTNSFIYCCKYNPLCTLSQEACYYKPAFTCHPECHEGSPASMHDPAGRRRSFAALRMTGEKVFVMAYYEAPIKLIRSLRQSSFRYFSSTRRRVSSHSEAVNSPGTNSTCNALLKPSRKACATSFQVTSGTKECRGV